MTLKFNERCEVCYGLGFHKFDCSILPPNPGVALGSLSRLQTVTTYILTLAAGLPEPNRLSLAMTSPAINQAFQELAAALEEELKK